MKPYHEELHGQINKFEHYPEDRQEPLKYFKLVRNVSVFMFQKDNFGIGVENLFAGAKNAG